MNSDKTKVMLVDRGEKINLTDTHIAGFEVVQTFVYLSSLISCHGSSEGEIRRRIQLAREAVIKLNRLWKNHDIRKATKSRWYGP